MPTIMEEVQQRIKIKRERAWMRREKAKLRREENKFTYGTLGILILLMLIAGTVIRFFSY